VVLSGFLLWQMAKEVARSFRSELNEFRIGDSWRHAVILRTGLSFSAIA
jgi:hypothetical protein